jgi:hypothetical protein
LKVLAANLADDVQFRARFEREADLAASLSHQNIVAVHDRGETNGRLWIALDFVDGVDLGEVVRRGPIPVDEVARVVGDVAAALDFAGAQGLIHRDVKPANVMVSTTGRVLLTDFGIARLGADNSELTGTGMTLGTISYASPEQLQGQPVDARSDQYSLAATAFHLLTGSVPFANTNAGAVIVAHVTAPVPSVRSVRPELSPRVDAVIARAMAKSPAERYPSSETFAADLGAALVADPTEAASPSAPTMVRGAATVSAAPSGGPGYFDPTVVRPGPLGNQGHRGTEQPWRRPRSNAGARWAGGLAALGGLAMVLFTFAPWMTVTRGSSWQSWFPGVGTSVDERDGKVRTEHFYFGSWPTVAIVVVALGILIAVVGVVVAIKPQIAVAAGGAVLGGLSVVTVAMMVNDPADIILYKTNAAAVDTITIEWGLWLVILGAVGAVGAFVTAAIIAHRRNSSTP